MPTEDEVSVGAEAIARSPLIDAPKLPAECWHGLARAVLEAAERKRDEAKRATCRHPRRSASGTLNSDGSSSYRFYCPDCGASGESSTPARSDGEGMRAMLMNMPR